MQLCSCPSSHCWIQSVNVPAPPAQAVERPFDGRSHRARAVRRPRSRWACRGHIAIWRAQGGACVRSPATWAVIRGRSHANCASTPRPAPAKRRLARPAELDGSSCGQPPVWRQAAERLVSRCIVAVKRDHPGGAGSVSRRRSGAVDGLAGRGVHGERRADASHAGVAGPGLEPSVGGDGPPGLGVGGRDEAVPGGSVLGWWPSDAEPAAFGAGVLVDRSVCGRSAQSPPRVQYSCAAAMASSLHMSRTVVSGSPALPVSRR